jgi:hypothetical protein
MTSLSGYDIHSLISVGMKTFSFPRTALLLQTIVSLTIVSPAQLYLRATPSRETGSLIIFKFIYCNDLL